MYTEPKKKNCIVFVNMVLPEHTHKPSDTDSQVWKKIRFVGRWWRSDRVLNNEVIFFYFCTTRYTASYIHDDGAVQFLSHSIHKS